MYDKAFFALAFLRQCIQEGKRTGDYKEASYWALEFLERREAARLERKKSK